LRATWPTVQHDDADAHIRNRTHAASLRLCVESAPAMRGVMRIKVKLKFPKSVATAIQLTYDSPNAQPVNLALAQVVSHGS
jgi:hypothetical protein